MSIIMTVSCHEQGGCRIDYLLLFIPDVCNCKVSTKMII